jgi:hypothetical protein
MYRGRLAIDVRNRADHPAGSVRAWAVRVPVVLARVQSVQAAVYVTPQAKRPFGPDVGRRT